MTRTWDLVSAYTLCSNLYKQQADPRPVGEPGAGQVGQWWFGAGVGGGAGSIISAASVRDSCSSSDVVVDDGAIVEEAAYYAGAAARRVRHAILDKNVVVGPGERSGSSGEGSERFAISAGGVVAVGKNVWIYVHHT